MTGWVAGVAATLLAMGSAAAASVAPGSLDSSFGQRGHVIQQVNPECARGCPREAAGSAASAVGLEATGQIVVGGFNRVNVVEQSSEAPGAIVRLESDGAPDSAFGSNGVVLDPTMAITHVYPLAAGGVLVLGTGDGGKLGVQRYEPNGTLDGSYAAGGVRWIATLPERLQTQLDEEGRLLVLTESKGARFSVEDRFTIQRLLQSGLPDPTFGQDGTVALPRLAGESSVTFATEPDGGMVIVGGDWEGGIRLMRLTPRGRIVRSFGKNGIVRLVAGRLGAGAAAPSLTVGVAPDGRILLAAGGLHDGAVLVAAYSGKGRLIRSLARDGIDRFTALGGAGKGADTPEDITFDVAGNPLVAGKRSEPRLEQGTTWLLRYTWKGRDCSFGARGVVLDPEVWHPSAIVVQPDGRIIVAGEGDDGFAVARYMGGGSPRTCHGTRPRPGG